jgi:predicted HAD superfamily Cof-like phosphohydrolase
MRYVTNYGKVREFHKAFGLDLDNKTPTKALVMLREELINEECREFLNEVFDSGSPWDSEKELVNYYVDTFDRERVAKELADILYVTYGTAAAFGIDIDAVFDIVHASNMSKLGEDGKPIYREDGKVLKGPNYKEADLTGVV